MELDLRMITRPAAAYQQLVKHDEIVQRVVDTLRPPACSGAQAGEISASLAPNALLMQISVVHRDPQRAAPIANTTAASHTHTAAD